MAEGSCVQPRIVPRGDEDDENDGENDDMVEDDMDVDDMDVDPIPNLAPPPSSVPASAVLLRRDRTASLTPTGFSCGRTSFPFTTATSQAGTPSRNSPAFLCPRVLRGLEAGSSPTTTSRGWTRLRSSLSLDRLRRRVPAAAISRTEW